MRRSSPTLALALLCISLVLSGCGRADPCVICPDVAGVYEVFADPMNPEQSSCGTIYFTGMDDVWTIEQTESQVRLAEWNKDGILYDDMSATFEPEETQVLSTEEDAWVTVTINFIELEGGGMDVEGYMVFRRVNDNCRINARFTGSRTSTSK